MSDTMVGDVTPGGLDEQDAKRPAPSSCEPPDPARTPRRIPRSLLAFLGAGMGGIVLMLAGLALDAFLHARGAMGSHEEVGLFTLANPGHVLLLAGGALAVSAFTAASVQGFALSGHRILASRPATGAVVTAVVVLAAATAGAMRWAPIVKPPVATGPLAPPPGADAHRIGLVNSHDDGPCRPTAAEKAAAAKLVSDTQMATARYRNLAVALADGYTGPLNPVGTQHYPKGANLIDGKVLDPTSPESLLYASTPQGVVLVAAMFMTNVPGEFGPEPGGCLTRWHVHTNVCFEAATFTIARFLEKPGDTCGPGTFRWVPPPALHVWFIDVPGGRFAPEVDPAVVAEVVRP